MRDPSRDLAGSHGPIEWAAATAALPGEATSGDLQVVQPFSGGILVAVLDALGHGDPAAAAAARGAAALARHAHEPVGSLLRRCHDSLLGTRGAVLSLASFDTAAGTLTWVGVGNVTGLLLPAGRSARPGRSVLVCPGGIVGSDLPRARPVLLPVAPGDTLIFATDGVDGRFADGIAATGPPRPMAADILARFGRKTDDALVLVARYVGEREATA